MASITPPTPGNKLFDRRRFAAYQVTLTPHDAIARCKDFWVSIGAHSEVSGMRDQFSQHGWVGTELIFGSTLRSFFLSPFSNDLPRTLLRPLIPKKGARAVQEKTWISIVARVNSKQGRDVSELWCFESKGLSADSDTNGFMDTALNDLTNSLTKQRIILGPPNYFLGGSLPESHPFGRANMVTMQRTAKTDTRTNNNH